MYQMPAIDLESLKSTLTVEEYLWAEAIVATQGKNKGCLRASKPAQAAPQAQYIWRMVAFEISPHQPHQCLPMLADWELYDLFNRDDVERMDKVNALCKKLDEVVNKIVDTVPANKRHGLKAWGRALGVF